MKRLRIALAAGDSAGIRTLRWLLEGDHAIVAVLAAGPSPQQPAATVRAAAERADLSVLEPARLRDPDYGDVLRAAEVDLLLNVHSLVVAHESVVAAPLIGSFNLHPGPLPEYAGLNAPSWAIYRGEVRHAVTVHWMTAGVDTGTIAYRRQMAIEPDETGLSLALKCTRDGLDLLRRLVETAAESPGSIPAHPQDLSKRRYFGRDAPNGGIMPWDSPARSLERLVRAADYGPYPSPWGRPRTRLNGRELGVVATALTGEPCSGVLPGTLNRADGEGVRVATDDEWLAVQRVEIDGKVADAADIYK